MVNSSFPVLCCPFALMQKDQKIKALEKIAKSNWNSAEQNKAEIRIIH
jgi:hypothetical protein